MIFVPMRDVKIPDFIYNKRVTGIQQEELSHGGRVMLEDCHYYGDDNTFKGEAQFDVHRMEFNIEKPSYSKPYIPEHIRKQLTTEMFNTLMAGGEIDGRKLVSKEGIPYTNNIRLNPETNATEFIRYRAEQAVEQTQQQQQGQPTVPEQEPMFMEENMNQGMRQGAGM